MANMTFSFLFSISILLIFLQFWTGRAQLVPAIYYFGDSLIDVGNNNFLKLSLLKADFPHNGVDFPYHKPTGRFCNGKNSADFISENLGMASPPPYLSLASKFNRKELMFLNGVNFASGGAGIFNSTSNLFRETISLTSQVDYYAEVYEALLSQLGTSALQTHLSKSLFVIVIGSNDMFGYFRSSNIRKNISPQEYVDSMVSTLKSQMQRLHILGARKFLIVGLGTIGCCPSQRLTNNTACNEETNFWSLKYNEGLQLMLQEFKSQFADINYSYFDTYTVLSDLIQSPIAYGFREVKSACCGLGDLRANVPCLPVSPLCSNRRDHVFWDLYHPTEATANIMANYILDGQTQ